MCIRDRHTGSVKSECAITDSIMSESIISPVVSAIGVLIILGQSALHLTPLFAHRIAVCFVIPRIAAFDAT